MRSFAAVVLIGSVTFAATLNQECKTNCTMDCMKVGGGDVGGTHCEMVFGTGKNGTGWYVFDDEGDSNTGGSPVPVGTCQESCEAACDEVCTPKGRVGHGRVVEAGDRYFGFGDSSYCPFLRYGGER